MKAAIFDAPEQMHVGDWPTPPTGPDEVLVRVRATGICAGDMYIYQGKNPYANYPIIGGHEICGLIAEVGYAVKHLSPGALVVVEPFLGCGRCYPCRVGKSNCCANLQIIGVHRAGGFAEFVVAPAWAAFAEPVAIGVQACRRGDVQVGEYMLVLGAGPIGLALIEVALARGARPVVTDINESRLEFARTLGAQTLKPGENLLKQVLDQTDGEGAPVVIEATGNAQAMETTVDLVAAGGRIVILGLVKRGTMVRMPGLEFTRKEMTVLGSRASVNCFPESLQLLASGKIRYPKVATQISMWEAPAAFAELKDNPGAMHKGVLVCE
jgi:L-gulonate 5-dehydrogenase